VKYIKKVTNECFDRTTLSDISEIMISENERLDEQLRNGTDYVNLPPQTYPTDQAPTWIRK
jgi:hypothetical protein